MLNNNHSMTTMLNNYCKVHHGMADTLNHNDSMAATLISIRLTRCRPVIERNGETAAGGNGFRTLRISDLLQTEY